MKTLSDCAHEAAMLHGLADGLDILLDDEAPRARNAAFALARELVHKAEALAEALGRLSVQRPSDIEAG